MSRPTEPTTTTPLRDAQRSLTRDRLIEAAIRVFERRGFGDATIEEIARIAGANRTTFYLHFNSKVEIAQQIGALSLHDLLDAYAPLLALDPIDAETVLPEIRRIAEVWERHRVHAGVAIQADAVDFGVSKALNDTIRSLAVAVLKRAGLPPTPRAVSRLVLMAMLVERYMFTTVVQGVELPEPEGSEILAEEVASLLRRAVDDARA